MDKIKRQTKRIISIILIMIMLINIFPNFGLLNISNAADFQSGIILKLNNEKGIWTDEYGDFNAISLDILVKDIDLTSFVLPIKFDSTKLTPAYYYVGRRDEYIDIATNAKEFTSEMNSDLPSTFNANDQTSETDWSSVKDGKIKLEFLDGRGESYNFQEETLICTINFIVDESITDISQINSSLINIDEDSNSFEIFHFESNDYKVDIDKYFSIQGINMLPTVKSIEVKTNPTEGNKYTHGETIDLTSGELLVTYTDNSTKTISMLDENVKIKTGEEEGAISNVNIPKLTFEYEKKVVDLNINVIDPVEYIEFYDRDKIIPGYDFMEGVPIPKDELFIKAITKSGFIEEICLSDSRVSLDSEEADTTKIDNPKVFAGELAGIQKIEITYQDENVTKRATFNILVNDTVGEIRVSTTNPPKTSFKIGDEFDKSGAIEIIGKNSGLSYGEIEMTSGDVTVTHTDGSKVDFTKNVANKELMVTYSGVSTTYTVNVENTVKSIRVNKGVETEYGKSLTQSDFSGVTLTEIMTDGTEGNTKALNFDWIDTTTYNNQILTKQELTVNYPYDGKIIEGKVTVKVKNKLIGITIDNLETEYVYKDKLNYENVELYVEYVSGVFGPYDLNEFGVTNNFNGEKIG